MSEEKKTDEKPTTACDGDKRQTGGGENCMDENYMEKQKLYSDILLREMEFDWNDHFEIRRQTWKTVMASGAILVALIGFNFSRTDSVFNGILLYGGCLTLFLVSLFGLIITFHHRRCEKDKFKILHACEEKLVIDDKRTSLHDLLKKATDGRIGSGHGFISTSSFIMVYHGAILLVLLILLFCRLHWLEYKSMTATPVPRMSMTIVPLGK